MQSPLCRIEGPVWHSIASNQRSPPFQESLHLVHNLRAPSRTQEPECCIHGKLLVSVPGCELLAASVAEKAWFKPKLPQYQTKL